MNSLLFKERIASQIPAVKLLINSGYEYLSPNECIGQRGDTNSVLLKDTLKSSLLKINSFSHNGENLPLPEGLVNDAIKELVDWKNTNLRQDNKDLYYHLINGKGLTFLHEGERKSAHLHFFDFKDISKNTFQVTEEFKVQRTGRKQHYVPDIVLLVNGIPIASIECKKPGLPDALKKGVEQHLRNQNSSGVTKLYLFQQVLGSVAGGTGGIYGSVGTPEEFWSVWKEDDYFNKEDHLKSLINKDISEAIKTKIFEFRHPADRAIMEQKWNAPDREVTKQDQCLYHVFRPDRLLDIFHNFIIYEGDVKIAPRHQQYFAVNEALKRVKTKQDNGAREGGVIWHTTGSGKSYTMVMLAKALKADTSIKDTKVVVVTDRVSLDKQIHDTFLNCGEEPHRAKSGDDLTQKIKDKTFTILTTIIDKFETVAKKKKVSDDSENIFVLVDESHRSNFGETHALMKNTFKNAAFIGFTGTPIRKKNQATEEQFGTFIHKYTMEMALADKAVCPIIYEGRMGELTGDKETLDRWFDRVTRNLNDDQKIALKKRFAREEEILKAKDRIEKIALDICNHYRENFHQENEPTSDFLKGQLATNSKKEALLYKTALEDLGIKVALVISPPDMREGATTIDEDDRPEVVRFWDNVVSKKHGGEKKYLNKVISGFNKEDEPEIIIVVDKLLTGFDAPRNGVLYIDKRLKEHNVLQAIARVNRLYPRKEHGLVVDYRGIFDDMNSAVDFYRKMENEDYSPEDIKDTLFDKSKEVAKLDSVLKALRDHFGSINNMKDNEEIGRYLADENLRKDFYQKFRDFHNIYKLATSYPDWIYNTSEKDKAKYKSDYKYFAELRTVIKERYPDGVDYEDYIEDISRLVDVNLKSDPPRIIVEQFNIFEKEGFEEATEDKTPGAKADIIKAQASAHASEHFDEDPIFYKRLSQIIEETYEAYKNRRMSDEDYLDMMEDIRSKISINIVDDVPSKVAENQTTKAYYRVLEILQRSVPTLSEDAIADLAIKVDEIVKQHAVRDWHLGGDVEKKIIGAVEIEVFYPLEDKHGISFSDEDMNEITENILLIAKRLDFR